MEQAVLLGVQAHPVQVGQVEFQEVQVHLVYQELVEHQERQEPAEQVEDQE